MAMGVVDSVDIFTTSNFITAQNLAAVSHTVFAHVGSPKILGTLGSTLGMESRGVADI